jgi:hypothetical protein
MNLKNKISVLLLFVVNMNCGGLPVLSDQEISVVRSCLEFMQGALLPIRIDDGMQTAFCLDSKTVNYPIQFKHQPFADRIQAFLAQTIDAISQTQNAMLKILVAFYVSKVC